MRVIIAIHGIRSRKSKNWMETFSEAAGKDPRFKDDAIVSYYYGYLPALESINSFNRHFVIRRFMKYIRDLKEKYPQAAFSIVAHSYGTDVSYQAIKRSGEDGKPPIQIDKLILVASIVSAHREIPYTDTLRSGKINEMQCYCSYEDEVCRYNPFGHSGCWGFLRDVHDPACYVRPFKDLRIFNHQTNTLEHGDYFTNKFIREWLDIIAG